MILNQPRAPRLLDNPLSPQLRWKHRLEAQVLGASSPDSVSLQSSASSLGLGRCSVCYQDSREGLSTVEICLVSKLRWGQSVAGQRKSRPVLPVSPVYKTIFLLDTTLSFHQQPSSTQSQLQSNLSTFSLSILTLTTSFPNHLQDA